MKYTVPVVLILFVVVLVFHRYSPSSVSTGHTLTVTKAPLSHSLFYSGMVQPLKTVVVPSPAEGVVIGMPFQYGEFVKAGQLLFSLSSTKFLTDYKSALLQYLKAKNDFNNSQTQLTEAKFLHSNQLISDDDFKSKQSNFYSSQLAFIQAKDTLENLIRQLDIKNINLYTLTIADIDKITQAMHMQMTTDSLRILSPAAGVVLAFSKNEEETKKFAAGDTVKQGDMLALIGDMSGISVQIKVNELTVNQLTIGQKVRITGIAFPEHVLEGEIKRVDRQGEASSSGLPTFLVQVIVPHLSLAEQKEIHVGMSAKVEIVIDENPQIMVPIAALHEKNGASFLMMVDKHTAKIHETAVKTGNTTTDSVAILSGLKSGDQIVVPG